MYEMWKEQQVQEDARKKYLSDYIWGNGESDIWEATICQEEWTGRVKF